MHILYITGYYKPAYVYGGPVNSVATLCEGMVDIGADVTVLTTNANGKKRLHVPLGSRVSVDGVSVYYFPLKFSPYFYSPDLVKEIPLYVQAADIMVIEAMWGHSLIPSATACLRYNKPYVIPIRGQLLSWARGRKWLKKYLYIELIARRYLDKCNAFHCTDPSESQATSELGLHPPSFIVPNGIRFSQYAKLPERGATRSLLGIPMDALELLFVGRLSIIKRPDIALELAIEASMIFDKEIHLVIVGPDEDNLVEKLRERARVSGFQTHLHFLGLIPNSDLIPIYRDADLLVMPSEIQENFGMTALEAMASGLPILVSTGIPVGKWAEVNGAGRAINCSVKAFIETGLEMLASTENLKEMGARGRRLAETQFDISVVATNMILQLQSIIETGKPIE
jgi:glycosyltransferase involved in cell wall biosynthesis